MTSLRILAKEAAPIFEAGRMLTPKEAVQLIQARDRFRAGVNPVAILALLDELAAMTRYAEALASGLSDSEAREEGWPQP